MKLKDRVAIVTGSSRNLGQGIALGLAREGAHIVVNGTKQDCVEATCRMIADLGAQVAGVTADVSTSQGAELLVNCALEKFGRVDILVNNAAVVAVIKHFLELTPEVWERIFAVNLGGLFQCSTRVARVMAQQRSGCIVNIGSVGSSRAHRNMAPYDTTKGGIEAATRAMAIDLAPFNIRVNAVSLGLMRTDRWDGVAETELDRRRRAIPLNREGTNEDTAETVAFLCSDAASYITGQVLYVDGGLLAQLRPADAESAPPPKDKIYHNFSPAK
jgi:3-oxoacyl-[acyl-carrier protein] reductase